ncbi:uncharacterized protein LOC130417222 [Triplophysa dalaica]|uniref:uncharacterized protein LOC130417222 n=1 Tax=Triplophysa dalaica TaxID=1582913 RepID=UPI0024DFC93C|nr:uncharacterized protein LOC130417222 [Triplophysa dalaica]
MAPTTKAVRVKVMSRRKLGSGCCALGCNMTSGTNTLSKIKMLRFPKDEERRRAWIAALRRETWQPGKNSKICSTHFVTGKKSDDPLHPDYVPSIFSFTSTADRHRAVKNLENYLAFQDVSGNKLAATALLNQAPALEAKVHPDEVFVTKEEIEEVLVTEIKTEDSQNDIASLYDQIASLNAECQSLRDKMYSLENELRRCTLDPSQFDDKKMKFFTGLPNSQTFMSLFNSVSSILPSTSNHSLKPTQELLLTLMKQRLNLSEGFLGYLFGIHQSTVSRILQRWNNVINNAKQNDETTCQSEGQPSDGCGDMMCSM